MKDHNLYIKIWRSIRKHGNIWLWVNNNKMDVQKVIWIFLLLTLIVKSLVGYLQDRSKWTACPFSLDLWQCILISLLTFILVLNMLSVILFRRHALNNCLAALIISLPLLQLTSIILLTVWTVLVIITIKSYSQCVLST